MTYTISSKSYSGPEDFLQLGGVQFPRVNPSLQNGGSWGNGGRVAILGQYG